MTVSEPPRTHTLPPRISPKKRGLNISGTQIAVVLVIIIALAVIIDFNRKIQSGQKITGEANEMKQDVNGLVATKAALATELAYVASDAYVQYWAHSDGRYVQANEILVVPVPAKKATTTPTPTIRVIQKPPSNFEIWWALFFESGS